MIQFTNVTKSFDSQLVLDHIDLEVSGGEFLVIIGPSGAGKSTLLHALMGEIPLGEGNIEVDGYEITKFNTAALQEYRQKVGMVFQDFRLLDKKTVYENVAFALEVCGWKDEDIRERVYGVLDLVGMLEHEGKFPEQLAGGEVQRTAIARALVHNPRLFIADEPTGNLDYWNTQEILKILAKINDSGVTVLLATHNREVVDSLQKRVITLHKGAVISDKEGGYDVDLLSNAREGVMPDMPASNLSALGSMGEMGGNVGDIEIFEIAEN